MKTPDELGYYKTLNRLIDELQRIRELLLEAEKRFAQLIASTDPSWRESARNLVHYLALRRFDMRELQADLAEIGVSSLGRSEGHVLITIESVLNILLRLAGHQALRPNKHAALKFQEGARLLEEHTRSFLGQKPINRAVRIMVTMPNEGANDYSLVRDLIASGTDCVRINCARDDESTWRQMTRNLRRASKELEKNCKVEFDLPGRKLRTGYIGPGPRAIKWGPKRDDSGKVLRPARIWLTHAERPALPDGNAAACLLVQGDWLASLAVGSTIRFTDLRDKKRAITVIGEVGESRWAESEATAYVGPETLLRTDQETESQPVESRIGEIPPVEASLLLRIGDILLLTSDSKTRLADEKLPKIGGLSRESLSNLKVGQSIWFDDGKIGGSIEGKTDDHVRVRITYAKPGGSKLRSDRGINLPGTHLEAGALGERDLKALCIATKCADSVALSFASSKKDVEALLTYLERIKRRRIGIVLKIETREGFENLPSMLLTAMRRRGGVGVMIARGDLAVECGYERLAELQEEILCVCEAGHVPVIWASDVLESLVKKGIPSRTEITDAAMSVRTECVMLNKGPHILKAVRALDDILRRMEAHQRKKASMLRKLRSLSLD
ncbi:MAG: pyruvate kinase [Candidatus Bathyarchaeia archaeon]